MHSSDEDFESADEGQGVVDKIGRKKRTSSSNYSDSAVDSNVGTAQLQETPKNSADGWDEIEEDIETLKPDKIPTPQSDNKNDAKKPVSKLSNKTIAKDDTDTGWDDFDDWESEPVIQSKQQPPQLQSQSERDIKEVTDRLAAASTEQKSSWGWGWGVDSLLNSATAGLNTITSQVSQGISTVLETGIGAPDPEDLARQMNKADDKIKDNMPHNQPEKAEEKPESGTSDAFPFGSLLSGVTKFVETTGTKVINTSLDTLETIGKKTMEVLQDGDPGLAKKRAMLGLDTDKPVLSQVLREAKAKAEEEDRIREEKREAKEVHYENLFDDYEGLVHLEALEMLSRQVSMRIEERLRSVDPELRQEIKETLQQVAELCEMPEEEDDDESPQEGTKTEVFHENLQSATQDLGIKIQFQGLIKHYTEILEWQLTPEANLTEKAIYKRAVSGLAQATALSVELYHKTAEMLLVKPRRSTADEADALTQLTVVLTKHVSDLATLFTEKLNSLSSENKELINNYITNIFLEAGNSSSYIQNAFHLALPILQIGAV